jgi:MFS transporter, MHS family, shikimate and dehydroshikimate transport protein
MASPFAGGLAPLIAAALLRWSGQVWPVAAYLVVMASITLLSVALATETHRLELTEP